MKGYKAFNKDMLAMNNIKFEIGKQMHIDGPIKAGPIDGNGFHFCTNFEDTFRFVSFESNVLLCEIKAFGKISHEYCDEYNGYYGIYSCSDIILERIIPRKEIITMASKLLEYRLKRFIQTYKLNKEELVEIRKIILNNSNLNKYFEYYQLDNKEVFYESKNIRI